MAPAPYKKTLLFDNMPTNQDITNHTHVFLTMADTSHGHQHLVLGTTSVSIPKKDTHIHQICIRTSFDPRSGPSHWHEIDIMTGPAFETPDGNHIHYFAGNTTEDMDHCHSFSSVTDISPEYTVCEEQPLEESFKHQYKRRGGVTDDF